MRKIKCECPVEGHVTGCPNDLMTQLRMTAPAKPDIDEQIEHHKQRVAFVRRNIERRVFLQSELDKEEAILATLEAHKRIIEVAEMPEPGVITQLRDAGDFKTPAQFSMLKAYDTLLAAYHKALAERDAKDRLVSDYEEWLSVQSGIVFCGCLNLCCAATGSVSLATSLSCQGENAAEATKRAETAERQLAELREKHERLVELLRPLAKIADTDGVGWSEDEVNTMARGIKAMSTVALRDSEGGE